MKIEDVTNCLEAVAPLNYQESYDNSGLITGSPDIEVTGILLCIDCIEAVVEEAIKRGCNMIVAHHPIVFAGIKKLNGKNYVERTLLKAIRNDVAIYACHTNIDNVINGVNAKIAEKIGLQNCRILAPMKGTLKKLVTFCPTKDAPQVRDALFKAGAGKISNYDSCSFNINGEGTFRGNEFTNPYVGKKGDLHTEKEIRIELIFQSNLQHQIINSLIVAHPYEEVAYDIYPLDNFHPQSGSGMIGELSVAEDTQAFLARVKQIFKAGCLKYTEPSTKKITTVAVCGGSGSFLLNDAIKHGAEVFITSDFKYHQFFDAEEKLVIADIGHYESEQFTRELFYEILMEKFPTFAIHFSEVNTNPVNYL